MLHKDNSLKGSAIAAVAFKSARKQGFRRSCLRHPAVTNSVPAPFYTRSRTLGSSVPARLTVMPHGIPILTADAVRSSHSCVRRCWGRCDQPRFQRIGHVRGLGVSAGVVHGWAGSDLGGTAYAENATNKTVCGSRDRSLERIGTTAGTLSSRRLLRRLKSRHCPRFKALSMAELPPRSKSHPAAT